MPKCVYDTSMDRRFVGEFIGINSAQLCARNGRVYTSPGTGNFPFVWMRAKSVFLSPRPRYKPRPRYLNTSTEVLTRPRTRVCKSLDRGISLVEVLVDLKGYKIGSWSINTIDQMGLRVLIRLIKWVSEYL